MAKHGKPSIAEPQSADSQPAKVGFARQALLPVGTARLQIAPTTYERLVRPQDVEQVESSK